MLTIFILFCKQSPEFFHLAKLTLYPLNTSSPPCLLAAETTILLPVSLTLLGTSYAWGHLEIFVFEPETALSFALGPENVVQGWVFCGCPATLGVLWVPSHAQEHEGLARHGLATS